MHTGVRLLAAIPLAAILLAAILLAAMLWVTCSASAQQVLPLSSIRAVLQQPAGSDVLLRGTVTYTGHELVMQDGTGALSIDPATPASIALGDEVEVQGSLEVRAGISIVRHAAIHALWRGSTPLPLAITADEAAEGTYNGMLVTSEGRIIKVLNASGSAARLTLDSGNQLFTCLLDPQASPEPVSVEVGATVRCTGILSVDPSAGASGAGTFLILLRSPADVHLLTAAPWWTPRHLLLLFVLMMGAVWVMYRVHMRNVRARMSLVIDERLRIAREIHDTLAQGFAGIALQLQCLTRTMEEQQPDEQSPAANRHLAMALQMVRQSRAEAHRSIATLRTLHSYEDVGEMCEKLLRQLTDPAKLRLELRQHGAPRPLPDEVSSQILRIAQEAIANVVEHAEARSVSVLLTYGSEALTVEIRDDGKGFDPARIGSVDAGHFGITGMRERAGSIGARFDLTSSANGTVLLLDVPHRGAPRWPQRLRHSWSMRLASMTSRLPARLSPQRLASPGEQGASL